MSKFLCLLAAVAAINLQAFEIERHTNVVHRNGMTLAQKGGLSDADYVVQDIEPFAFSNGVTSVNGETGAVVITASKIGAVPTTRTINGKGLGANIALTPGDIGAVAVGSVVGPPRTLAKYLHELSFDDSYPDEAQEYYRTRGNGKTAGGCSVVRDGGLMYRNFDYPFDERAEFVIRMSAGVGRFASVGVAQVGTNLTEEIVTSGLPEFSRRYKWLPGATVDGINECGVTAAINVTDDVPSWHSTGSLHPLGVIRWVLDHATNALHGAEYVAANVRFPAGWVQNFHYMIADREKTYLVENGEVYDFGDYHESDEPAAMTNFPLNRFPWSGMGMERFGLLLRGESITNAWYTRAYLRETTPPWVSEFSADVLARTNEIFNAWASHPREYFRGKTNGGEPWWQTVHTSVYDIEALTLRLSVQESGDWYSFAVAQGGKVKSVNGRTGDVTLTADDVGAIAAGENPNGSFSLDPPGAFIGGTSITFSNSGISHSSHITPDVEDATPEYWNWITFGGLGIGDWIDFWSYNNAPVKSVNNKTGSVTLNYSDVGAWDGRHEVAAALALGYYGRVFPGGTPSYSLTWSSAEKRYVAKWPIGEIPTSRYLAYTSDLNDYVPSTRTINGQPLTGDVTIATGISSDQARTISEGVRTSHPYLEVGPDGGIYVEIPEE